MRGSVVSEVKDNSKAVMLSEDVRMSSLPGYLELSPDKMGRLICQTPLSEEYEVEDYPFARGKYAAVRRCRDRKTGVQYAAKFLKKQRRSADLRPEILHEVAILCACASSPRIVKLHRVFESQHEMVLLLELAPGGELQMLLDNDEVPDEPQVKRLMRQILDGLVYLHDANVAHLDLKPQNLVLTGTFPDCDVKLCDLGISRYISAGADIRDILGTPDYVAPEVLNYESISLATDMWSVGVLLYVLLTGCSPFGGDTKQETFCNISQCALDFPAELFDDISPEAICLMRQLMRKDPSSRLNARQCLQHRWFSDADVEPQASAPRTSLPKGISPAPIRKHKAPVEAPEIVDKPLTEPAVVATPTAGMKSFRREHLNRNLSQLAERFTSQDEVVADEAKPVVFISVEDTDVAPAFTSVQDEALPLYASTPLPAQETPVPDKPASVPEEKPKLFTSVASVKTQQTAPEKHLSVFTTTQQATPTTPATFTRRTAAKGAVNKYTKCLTTPDVDSESGRLRKCKSMHLLPTTPAAASDEVKRRPIPRDLYSFRKCIVIQDEDADVSPPMSIAGSVTSSLASDCDSSELSIDSSSDRSSIISLEDAEYNPRTGRYNHNVWEKRMSESFASAFRRFSLSPGDGMRVARGAATSAVVGGRGCRLELRRGQGNVVVIREVKAGRFVQVNEVKCETVRERIRRLQTLA